LGLFATPASTENPLSERVLYFQGNPNDVTLKQNAPNPFKNKTVISYFIPETVKKAQLLVYDPLGNVMKRVDIRTMGEGNITIDASNLKRGIYKYSIIADGKVMDTKTMIH
jgi:hypothetical protein